MDILLFGLFLGAALVAIALDFYSKDAAYMAVIGGIIMILLGVFVSVDGSLTQSFCVSDGASGIVCEDHTLITFAFWNLVAWGLGSILMLLGTGTIVDSFVREREYRKGNIV